MKSRRSIDKSNRPTFLTNEELEAYLKQKAEDCERELEAKRLYDEMCRKKRAEAYKHNPTELEVYDDWEKPQYTEDGKIFKKLNYVYGYNKKITIKEGVEEISCFALAQNEELTQVNLPSTLKIIGESAFWKCGIKEIVIPEGVEIIKSGAFTECKNLERISLPSSLKEIQCFTFEKCNKLKEINIPDGTIVEWSVFPCHLKELEKYEMPWEEMRVYEEWRKTHDDILEWRNQREAIMSIEYKRIADDKAKEAAEREERNREYKKKHRFETFSSAIGLIKVIFYSIFASVVILVAILPLFTWWLISLIFHTRSPLDYLREKIR